LLLGPVTGTWAYHTRMANDGSGAKTKEKAADKTPEIYQRQAPRAQYVKAVTQMGIGIAAAVTVLILSIDLSLKGYTGARIEEHIFVTIGVALAVGAAIELAYTLFTHGPDEALDPLMLGLSAAIILQLGKVHGFDLRQATSAILYVVALGTAFAVRKYLADDIKVGDPNWSGPLLDRLRHRRDHSKKPRSQQDAAAIYRETGDRHGEGMALDNLGAALHQVRRFEEAISAHQDAAAIYRETGDRHGEGMALNNLGNALRGVRRFEEAMSAHADAAAIFEETGDRHSEGIALGNLESDRGAQAADSDGQ